MNSDRKGGIFTTDISTKQSSDTGMAAVLILLLIGFFTGNVLYYKIAIPVLVANMIWPSFFYPLAIVWLGFSHLLGTIMSKILLSLVFLILVVPFGLVRKLMGKDSLKLNIFKKDSRSIMVKRSALFSSKDIEHPF